MKYEELTRKEKQLLALEYPYKSDRQLWDTTLGKSQYDSSKFFNSPEQIEELKEQMAQEDVSLTNRSDFVTGEPTTAHSDTISILDKALGPFGEDVYRNMLEMSQKEMNPVALLKDLILMQAQRLEMGMQYEVDVGMGNNPETEACARGFESMLKTLNDMINGERHNVTVNHSVSSMISEMNLKEEDFIDLEEDMYDYTED